MQLIISSLDPDINGRFSERFGRCPYFIKVDTETAAWESFTNPAIHQSGGAGIAAAQLVIDQKVQAAISGSFGPNASNALRAGKVAMYTVNGQAQTVAEVVELFKQGQLSAL